MTVISNLTLRQRLLGSFVLVASVTILSGVSGIVSLQRISRNVQKMSEQVSGIVDQQRVQTRRVTHLRDVVYRIDHAVTPEDLEQIDLALKTEAGKWGGSYLGQQQRLEQLFDAKRAEIVAGQSLSQLQGEVGRWLDGLNLAMADATVPALDAVSDVPNAEGPSARSRSVQRLTARAGLLEFSLAVNRLLNADSAEDVQIHRHMVEALYDHVVDQLERVGLREESIAVRDPLGALKKNMPRLAEARSRYLECGDRFVAGAEAVFGEVQKLSNAVVAVVDHLDASVHDQFAASYLSAQSSMTVFIGLSVIAFSLSIGIGIRLARSFSASIDRVVIQAKEVADGDLTQNISSSGRDEIGNLANHFNVMLRNLKEMLTRVQRTALQITSTGQEIQVINEAQAYGATRQSSAVSETTTAAANLSQTSEQIGHNIETISQMANHVLAGMEKIKQATDQTNRIMLSLNEKSKQIGNITELIDDVADQTNLLAVNASIEAARAGEQGRGFTVVADQIGKLADSTAKSTKDITSLIEMIQHEMSNAIVAMEQSLTGVEEEIQYAKDSATKSREIAMSANQQIDGSRQIAEAMAGIDQTMKDIVLGATRSAEAAQLLTGLADDLKESMSRFKVNEDAVTSRPESAAR